MFVEPPWDYTVKGNTIELDVMGNKQAFALRNGPPKHMLRCAYKQLAQSTSLIPSYPAPPDDLANRSRTRCGFMGAMIEAICGVVGAPPIRCTKTGTTLRPDASQSTDWGCQPAADAAYGAQCRTRFSPCARPGVPWHARC